jgi:arginyl-tRNA synthetase
MTQLPVVPDGMNSSQVLTTFNIYIAKHLSKTLPLTLEQAQALAGVDYRKKGGDLTVALLRFRLPGKVAEIAAKVIEGVSPLFMAQFLFLC